MCLKEVAQVIKASLKRPGDFCGRYGGEEFLVILPDTPLKGALHVAERIRANIHRMEFNQKGSPTMLVTLSMGVATTNGDSSTSHYNLLKQADTALYRAKKQGKDQVQIYGESEA